MRQSNGGESLEQNYANRIKGQSFKELARKADDSYAASEQLPVIEGALRVEQGEYVVTKLSNPIGTHNLQQCVAIYVKGKDLHGLAHVDGHVEVSSLDSFFNKFDQHEKLEVKIFGATSVNSSNLDNSGINLAKVTRYLESRQDLFTEDVAQIIGSRDTQYKHPMFYSDGTITNALASGFLKEEEGDLRALHSIQEVRRHNRYGGTYGIIEGNNLVPQPIYLDELALSQLKSYKIDPEQDYADRDKNGERYDYDKAVPYILDTWQKEVLRLSQVKPSFDVNPDTLFRLIESTPLYIGPKCAQENQLIEKALTEASDIQDLQSKLLFIATKHTPTSIDQALRVAAQYDPTIDQTAFIKHLTSWYNLNHEFHLTEEQIRKKQYGGEITTWDFLNCLESHSKELHSWMVLNNQGGYYIDSGTREPLPYKISDAKQAFDMLGFDNSIIDEIVQRDNGPKNADIKINEEGKFSQDDLLRALEASLKNVKRKDRATIKRLVRDFKDEYVDLQDVYNKLQHSKISAETLNGLMADVKQNLQHKINEKKYNLITDDSNYYSIRAEVFERLPHNKFFSDLTISVDRAQGIINHDRQLHVIDQGAHSSTLSIASSTTLGVEKSLLTNHYNVLAIASTAHDEQSHHQNNRRDVHQKFEQTISAPLLGDMVNNAALGLTLWQVGRNLLASGPSIVSRNFGKVASTSAVKASKAYILRNLGEIEETLSTYGSALTQEYRQTVDQLNALYDKRVAHTISASERLTEESLQRKYQAIKKLYDQASELASTVSTLRKECDANLIDHTKIRTAYMRDMNTAVYQLRKTGEKLREEYKEFQNKEKPIATHDNSSLQKGRVSAEAHKKSDQSWSTRAQTSHNTKRQSRDK
ncbi:hypothetical protein EDM53_02065 [Rickettsiales endosymbiont of Peranema trichophorum]|uniref:hypothetical protein n=1 Tax=Rickettsiales endosymbiont of Peranema trichophorum TaxID=2486577 RepID=UPI001023AFF0|nr:hypothetical protein [Rickettsiales endosymbiont of Peranema trichophorum]RZI47439.1 hypothetical protein EDM53_02065 [Rickettsiales endosymbiont of Peranema trichophorum]